MLSNVLTFTNAHRKQQEQTHISKQAKIYTGFQLSNDPDSKDQGLHEVGQRVYRVASNISKLNGIPENNIKVFNDA